MKRSPLYVVGAVRTARGKRKGKFSSIHPVDLLTHPLNALIKHHAVDPHHISDVSVGCVTQTQEQGWCIGRSAVLAAGWPIEVPAHTVNRLCGSGILAIGAIASGIQSGYVKGLGVAAGVEHMTRVPMFSDVGGEQSPLLAKHHPDLVQQGFACERIIKKYQFTRQELDAFAVASHQKAAHARAQKYFESSIVPVPYTDAEGKGQIVDNDEGIRPDSTIATLATLKTVFLPEGALTAGNSSAIVDGAAAALIADEATLKTHHLTPRAEILSIATVGSDPYLMLTGPVEASRRVLKDAGLTVQDIDLWEINEAFAPIPLLTIRELGIDSSKVNVNGGAIALGHPLGATGVMLVGTIIDELHRTKKHYGLVTMCIGLGMGVAILLRRVP